MPRYFFVLLFCFFTAAASKDRPDIGVLAANELLTFGRQAVARSDWGQAIEDLRAAVREDPSNADAHNLLAFSYRKQERPDIDAALTHYKIALSLNPQHRGAHEYIGEAYLMLGLPEKAREHLATLESICGNRLCDEYRDLAQAIEGSGRSRQKAY